VHTTFGNAEGSASAEGVLLGVDTHLEVHVVVAVDQLGREAWVSKGYLPQREAMRDSFVGRRALAPWGVPE
jgi:hypothetical protein